MLWLFIPMPSNPEDVPYQRRQAAPWRARRDAGPFIFLLLLVAYVLPWAAGPVRSEFTTPLQVVTWLDEFWLSFVPARAAPEVCTTFMSCAVQMLRVLAAALLFPFHTAVLWFLTLLVAFATPQPSIDLSLFRSLLGELLEGLLGPLWHAVVD